MTAADFLTRALTRIGQPDETGTAEKILDAARHQFELVGIARTTVEDIRRRSRLARVTLYRHYPSKQAIIEAVILREFGHFLAELNTEMARQTDPAEKLVEGFVFTLDSMRSHVLLKRLLETEPETLLPYLTTEGQPVIDAGALFLANQLINELHDSRSPADILMATDLAARLVVSLVLTPSTNIELADTGAAREFARACIAPLLNMRMQR